MSPPTLWAASSIPLTTTPSSNPSIQMQSPELSPPNPPTECFYPLILLYRRRKPPSLAPTAPPSPSSSLGSARPSTVSWRGSAERRTPMPLLLSSSSHHFSPVLLLTPDPSLYVGPEDRPGLTTDFPSSLPFFDLPLRPRPPPEPPPSGQQGPGN